MGKVKVLAKHCRRIGENITGQAKFRKILGKRGYAPGIHGPNQRFPRISEYGMQLKEKQKMRYTYGLRDRQLRKYFEKAVSTKGNTGDELLRFLERRLDNVIYRLGFAVTRAQARQMVNHGHVLVNGKKLNIPSYSVRIGDKVTLKEKSKSMETFKQNIAGKTEIPEWLDFDTKEVIGQVINLPQDNDLQVGIDTRLIIEYYSR